MELLLMLALLPAAVLMVLVYRMDKVEKEPIGLIARVFVLGVVAGPVAAILESVAFMAFEAVIPSGTVLIVVECFLGVAVIEEVCKFLALSSIRKNPEFNYVFDGVVYAVAAALGFAALENVLYVLEGGIGTAIVRGLLSVPGHCADGVVMGTFYGLARLKQVTGDKSGARLFYVLSLLLPIIEHGFYDSALMLENDALAIVAVVVELAFVAIGGVLIFRMSKNDRPFWPDLVPIDQGGNLQPPAQGQVPMFQPNAQALQQNYWQQGPNASFQQQAQIVQQGYWQPSPEQYQSWQQQGYQNPAQPQQFQSPQQQPMQQQPMQWQQPMQQQPMQWQQPMQQQPQQLMPQQAQPMPQPQQAQQAQQPVPWQQPTQQQPASPTNPTDNQP